MLVISTPGKGLKFLFDTVGKTAVIFLEYKNLTLQKCQDVQQEQLQHIIFHPKSVESNKASSFCFLLSSRPLGKNKATKSGINWHRSMASMKEFGRKVWPCKTIRWTDNSWRNTTAYICVYVFNCFVRCFSMTVCTPAVLSVLYVCVLYLPLFSAIEHVSHGKVL